MNQTLTKYTLVLSLINCAGLIHGMEIKLGAEKQAAAEAAAKRQAFVEGAACAFEHYSGGSCFLISPGGNRFRVDSAPSANPLRCENHPGRFDNNNAIATFHDVTFKHIRAIPQASEKQIRAWLDPEALIQPHSAEIGYDSTIGRYIQFNAKLNGTDYALSPRIPYSGSGDILSHAYFEKTDVAHHLDLRHAERITLKNNYSWLKTPQGTVSATLAALVATGFVCRYAWKKFAPNLAFRSKPARA